MEPGEAQFGLADSSATIAVERQNLERFLAEPRPAIAVVGGNEVKNEVAARVGGNQGVEGGFEQRAKLVAVAGSEGAVETRSG